MTDICKCPGTDCPQREQCYRFTASAGERQVWSDFSARLLAQQLGGDCEFFYQLATKEEATQ